ncbi:hypothetical protein N7533_005147 [Penicillium manginii]|uniref:uncharacterized protein n=1 Tax=Penicillium manginii TaxID=203109 RepID=UPI0025472A27|nr:uncharacterized protein N7533_005147 [Penicillium manginii]KAJ5755604.1 hypothetical protein N7533_005147 [Penicillium manginii]
MPRRREETPHPRQDEKRRRDSSPEPSTAEPSAKKGRKDKGKNLIREPQGSQKISRTMVTRSALRRPSPLSQEVPEPVVHKRWPRQDPPITNVNDIPKSWEWHPNEPGLDPNDIDGHIARNRERIEDGILPAVFEIRLKQYEARKKRIDDIIASEPAGLDETVVARLNTLKTMKTILERDGDEREQLPNINALIKAYRAGKLSWSYEGKFHNKYDSGKGFWVEGFSGPGPKRLMAHMSIPPNLKENIWPSHTIVFELRAPGVTGIYWSMEFLEDTGASTMSIFDTDLDQLIQFNGNPVPVPICLGDTVIQTASDILVEKAVIVEARVTAGEMRTKWFTLEAIIRQAPKKGETGFRLSGSWWREALYTASFPDSQRNLIACDNYWEFLKLVPDVNPDDVIPISPPKKGDNVPGKPRGNAFDLFL